MMLVNMLPLDLSQVLMVKLLELLLRMEDLLLTEIMLLQPGTINLLESNIHRIHSFRLQLVIHINLLVIIVKMFHLQQVPTHMHMPEVTLFHGAILRMFNTEMNMLIAVPLMVVTRKATTFNAVVDTITMSMRNRIKVAGIGTHRDMTIIVDDGKNVELKAMIFGGLQKVGNWLQIWWQRCLSEGA